LRSFRSSTFSYLLTPFAFVLFEDVLYHLRSLLPLCLCPPLPPAGKRGFQGFFSAQTLVSPDLHASLRIGQKRDNGFRKRRHEQRVALREDLFSHDDCLYPELGEVL